MQECRSIYDVSFAVTVPASYVKQLRYDPDWRRVINGEKGTPPKRFPVPSGALDAEFRF